MAQPPFIPFGRQKLPWEPMVQPAKPSGAQALVREQMPAAPTPVVAPSPVPPREAPLSAEARMTAALRAEFEAKDAARAKEHQAALAALKQQQAEFQAQQEQMLNLCQQAEAARRGLVRQFREGAGALIFAAARRVAGEGLKQQPELLTQLVNESIDALGRQSLVIYSSEKNAEHLAAALKDSGIRVEVDAKISGGLRAESPAGRIDASMEAALAAIADVIEQWQKTQD